MGNEEEEGEEGEEEEEEKLYLLSKRRRRVYWLLISYQKRTRRLQTNEVRSKQSNTKLAPTPIHELAYFSL